MINHTLTEIKLCSLSYILYYFHMAPFIHIVAYFRNIYLK
jgi:hypothetical protein